MPLEILSPGRDGERWRAAAAGLPAAQRDIHLLPEYVSIYRDCYGDKPFLALHHGAGGNVMQCFIRRDLGSLPFLAGAPDAGRFSDIANAYGYGGPVCSAGESEEGRSLYRVFASEFAEWCEAEAVASEFCSLHPLMTELQRGLIGGSLPVTYIKDVVVIDLRPTESEIADGLRKGHRSSIALARRSSVQIEKVEPSTANLDAFRAMYEATMLRRQAAERWFLPENFFATTCRSLGAERTTLLFAYVGVELESGCLLMHDFSTAYYHFAGTYAKHPALGVNNLMVWEAAMHAKRAGYQRLHLGGGVTAKDDDSLLRFKAGFSNGRAPLNTYFALRNREVYDELSARKRAHERQMIGAESQSDFLPLYRR
jgi:Acetyltransferase (GNAT) domain